MAIPMAAMMAMGAGGGGKGGGAGGLASQAGGMNPAYLAGGALAGAIMGKERGKAWREKKDEIAAHQAYSHLTRIPLQHLQQEPLQMESILRGVAMGAAMGQGKSPWGKGKGNQSMASYTPDEGGNVNPYALNMAAMR